MKGSDTPLDAVLFDMDGVVTDTAVAHAAAWKRLFDDYLEERAERRGEAFQPFDIDRDYRAYVDGKPRYDGVRSFLSARGIELAFGSEDDPPDVMTVCGLGNRKQGYFRAWLSENKVPAFPGTLALIEALHREGIKTALFTSSRNADAVLENAGLAELFEVKLDGADLASLGLPGKPDPAMLLEAASRLGAAPAHTAVVEDAISGIEAGRRGGFALVVGIARGDDPAALEEAGAGIVVGDAAELAVDGRRLTVKTLAGLPSVRDHEADIRALLAGRRPAAFLDYDGTLTPIVADHRKALLSDDMRAALAALAGRCPVAVVSGRDLDMLRRLVGLDNVYLAGSHGFEIAVPGGAEVFEMGAEFLPDLDAAERELTAGLDGISGYSIERKRFSVAVHYRQVAAAEEGQVAAVVDRVLARHPRLARGLGKKVLEIRPAIDWHKGRAVDWLLERLKLDGPDVAPIYVGDDITDEDAFRALAGRGLTVVVRDAEPRRTAADFALGDTGEVRRFLEWLAEQLPEFVGGRE